MAENQICKEQEAAPKKDELKVETHRNLLNDSIVPGCGITGKSAIAQAAVRASESVQGQKSLQTQGAVSDAERLGTTLGEAAAMGAAAARAGKALAKGADAARAGTENKTIDAGKKETNGDQYKLPELSIGSSVGQMLGKAIVKGMAEADLKSRINSAASTLGSVAEGALKAAEAISKDAGAAARIGAELGAQMGKAATGKDNNNNSHEETHRQDAGTETKNDKNGDSKKSKPEK